MKRILLGIVALLAFPFIGSSQTNSLPTGTLSLSLQERYIALRGSRILHEGWSLWSQINVNFPAGFYIDLWNHHALEGRSQSKQPDELDMALGWNRTLPRNLTLTLEHTYLNNSPLELWWNGDVMAETLAISKTYTLGQHTLKPQVNVQWLWETRDVDSGVVVLLPNISHVWKNPFGIPKLRFAEQAFIVHDDGFKKAHNDRDAIFFRWHAGLKWQLTERMTLTLPSFIALVPLQKGKDGRNKATSWGTSLSYSF